MVAKIKCKRCRIVWNIPFSGHKTNSYSFTCDCKKKIDISTENNEIVEISGGTKVNEGSQQSLWSV